MASKYQPLGAFLATRKTSPWHATFKEIEGILGEKLCPSARRYLAWWGNDRSHSQARAWMDAGWEKATVSIDRELIEFHRVSAAVRPAAPSAPRALTSQRPSASRPPRSGPPPLVSTSAGTKTLSLEGIIFHWAAVIQPVREPDGRIREDLPQERYANPDHLTLNAHGQGPFCEFTVPGLPSAPGVYAVTVADRVVYVGIAKKDLRERWGSRGYARIHPRNCFQGGQSTNCKVNHAVLVEARADRAIRLWIHETPLPRPLEARLIRALDPAWNTQA